MKARSELENILDTDPGQNIILRELDVLDWRPLMLANSSMHQFFNKLSPDIWLDKLKNPLAQKPDEKKTRFILRRNPNLLNVEIKEVVLPRYTLTNMTPLQLAQSAGDFEMRDNVLKPLFIEFYGDEDKAIEKMQEQIAELKNFHKAFDFGPIIQAISNETFTLGKDRATNKCILSPETLAAIETFQKDYDASQPKIIDKAMQFRWETLQEFSDAYHDAAVRWNYDYKKCALLEDAALATVLGFATENDKQRFNQGIYYLQKDNPEPFNRMKKTRDGHDFDAALKKPSVDFLLHGSCVDIIFGQRGRVGSGERGADRDTKFLSSKNFKLAELMQPEPRIQSRSCVMF